jgi:hypothetical protein
MANFDVTLGSHVPLDLRAQLTGSRSQAVPIHPRGLRMNGGPLDLRCSQIANGFARNRLLLGVPLVVDLAALLVLFALELRFLRRG